MRIPERLAPVGGAYEAVVVDLSTARGIERIDVLDALGRTIKSVRVNGTRAFIPTSDLPNGTYFVRMNSETEVRTMSFVRY